MAPCGGCRLFSLATGSGLAGEVRLLPVFQCYIFHKHKSYLLCEITLIFIGHFLYLFAQINIQTNAFYNGIL
mgnify:FL=1